MQLTDVQLGVIIGGSVGALFLLAIVIAVGTYCKRRLVLRAIIFISVSATVWLYRFRIVPIVNWE